MGLVANGKRVRRLGGNQCGWSSTLHQQRDRYGQTLAYVFLDDATLLNAEIMRQGLWLCLHPVSVLTMD